MIIDDLKESHYTYSLNNWPGPPQNQLIIIHLIYQ